MTSSAASAASLLGRRPLRRELARTIDKCGGLTTDNLIEGGQEKILSPDPMSLLFRLLAASDSRRRSEKTGAQEARRQVVSPDPMSLLLRLLAASDSRRRSEKNRSTGGQ